MVGYRRESEFDDNGETYDMYHDGPDIWITVSVPAGVHRLSAYFVNKDGHDGSNRYRDYKLDLLTYHEDPGVSAKMKPLASGRVRQFWDGVYQSFAVCGPSKFYLRISRNGSFNTILSAVFLDKLSGPATQGQQLNLWSPYFHAQGYKDYIYPPSSGHLISHVAGIPDTPPAPVDPSPTIAQQVWDKLGFALENEAWTAAVIPARMLCYRSLAAAHRKGVSPGDTDRLDWWRRNLPFETDDDRKNFAAAMAQSWTDELKLEPELNRSDL